MLLEGRTEQCPTADTRKSSQLMFPGRTGEPAQNHQGEIASDRAADTFPQIQLDLTDAEWEREWYRGGENEISAVLKAPGHKKQ